MFAPPRRSVIRRTTSPTATASSTIDTISRGVETATSTPQRSSKSHSLRGSLTRATTRETANSVLASRLTTRLALSSPPTRHRPSISVVNTLSSTRRRCADRHRRPDGVEDALALVDEGHLMPAGSSSCDRSADHTGTGDDHAHTASRAGGPRSRSVPCRREWEPGSQTSRAFAQRSSSSATVVEGTARWRRSSANQDPGATVDTRRTG